MSTRSNFELVVVCNGGDQKPLPPISGVGVINRPNHGYNIGAWDAGWRALSDRGFKYFVFLQDDCFLKTSSWLEAFEERFEHDAGVGVLGESFVWDRMGWDYIRWATDRHFPPTAADPASEEHVIDTYRTYIEGRGIDHGGEGTHLQSLVLAARNEVLQQTNGFPTGSTYREAVGCEIAFSRMVESLNWRLSLVGPRPFSVVGHRQWTRRHRIYSSTRAKLAGIARSLGLKS